MNYVHTCVGKTKYMFLARGFAQTRGRGLESSLSPGLDESLKAFPRIFPLYDIKLLGDDSDIYCPPDIISFPRKCWILDVEKKIVFFLNFFFAPQDFFFTARKN